MHVYKGNEAYAQNDDGSPHDGSMGSPPKNTKKSLKKQTGWDWDQKDQDWLNKISVTYEATGYYFINYPNGRTVTIYQQPGLYTVPYSPSNQDLRNYYYGPNQIDLSGGNATTSPTGPMIAPIPNPVPIPGPVPMPIPVMP